MHWTLWTILIAVILIVIEFLVIRCLEVKYGGEYHNILLPIWVYVLMAVLAAVPILNLIASVVFPIVLGCNIEDNYYDCQLKDVKKSENRGNIMLHIITLLRKEV